MPEYVNTFVQVIVYDEIQDTNNRVCEGLIVCFIKVQYHFASCQRKEEIWWTEPEQCFSCVSFHIAKHVKKLDIWIYNRAYLCGHPKHTTTQTHSTSQFTLRDVISVFPCSLLS